MNLSKWFRSAHQLARTGQLPQYIPFLNSPDRQNQITLAVGDTFHSIYTTGGQELTFPLMSVIKPFLLFYLLKEFDPGSIASKVGQTPSDYPFNSLRQLREDGGFPRNPMINSGALALTDLLPGDNPCARCENLRSWLDREAGTNLFLSEDVLTSVQSLPNPRNRDLVRELTIHNRLHDPETVLETYNHICCLSGTIIDLIKLGLLLIESNSPQTGLVIDIMASCGLYEASGEFHRRTGLSTKSGVSGIILSIVPHQGVIACYSPPLDRQGNSVAGLFLVEKLAQLNFQQIISEFVAL
ncbi:MAG: Glutaminase [Chroococcopsis gigantea SAG 12.99]|jgi:glutaminase|nr:glutaminase [Chlorogloea purpurea SAG 13.99]MDV3000975.1 Glutaminase [Chroococcopsis gigantea SAG 12.99]